MTPGWKFNSCLHHHTMKSILRCFAIILAALLGIGSAGCKPESTGKSVLTTTIGARQIRATVEGSGSIGSQDSVARISIPGHKITVESERVLLDDAELAKLPAAATKVEIDVAGGQLTVTADGAAVVTKQLK